MITKTKLKKYLTETFSDEYKKSLENWVIKFACQNSGYSPIDKLKDISKYGCVSGCVGPLIYHADCRIFFNKFEEKIWDLIDEFRDSTGQTLGQFFDSFQYPIENKDNFKTILAWFAVEETASKILNHFEIEY